jgi:hypothetical protein
MNTRTITGLSADIRPQSICALAIARHDFRLDARSAGRSILFSVATAV